MNVSRETLSCRVCGKNDLEESDFYLSNGKIRQPCKSCYKEHRNKVFEEDRSGHYQKVKESRAKHREKYNAYMREYNKRKKKDVE